MAAPTKLEFTVKMTCQSCVDAVKAVLSEQEGVTLTGIDLSTQQVLVETTQPSAKVKELIEQSGRRAALMGMGSTITEFKTASFGKIQQRTVHLDGQYFFENAKVNLDDVVECFYFRSTATHLGAAVSMIAGGNAQGVARLLQQDAETCLVEGTVDGLQPGPHRIAIHEYGDLSQGCHSCGDVLDMLKSTSLSEEMQGDLGVVQADDAGRAEFRMMTSRVKVWDIIGRSMILHKSGGPPSENTKLACGIIARSSGLFENAKRICACDGVSVWDERDVPIAGPDRQQLNTAPSAQL